jgi:hypothetical protein
MPALAPGFRLAPYEILSAVGAAASDYAPRQLDRGGEALTLAAGTRLGPYETLSFPSGQGETGELDRARDDGLTRAAEPKVLPPDGRAPAPGERPST